MIDLSLGAHEEARFLHVFPAMEDEHFRRSFDAVIEVVIRIKVRQAFRGRHRLKPGIALAQLVNEGRQAVAHFLPRPLGTFFVKHFIRMNEVIEDAIGINRVDFLIDG